MADDDAGWCGIVKLETFTEQVQHTSIVGNIFHPFMRPHESLKGSSQTLILILKCGFMESAEGQFYVPTIPELEVRKLQPAVCLMLNVNIKTAVLFLYIFL